MRMIVSQKFLLTLLFMVLLCERCSSFKMTDVLIDSLQHKQKINYGDLPEKTIKDILKFIEQNTNSTQSAKSAKSKMINSSFQKNQKNPEVASTQIPIIPTSRVGIVSTNQQVLVPLKTDTPSFAAINLTDYSFKQVKISTDRSYGAYANIIQLSNGNFCYFGYYGTYILDSKTFQLVQKMDLEYYPNFTPISLYDATAKKHVFLIHTTYDGIFLNFLNETSGQYESKVKISNPLTPLYPTGADSGVTFWSDSILYRWETFTKNRLTFKNDAVNQKYASYNKFSAVFPSENKFITFYYAGQYSFFEIYEIDIQNNFTIKHLNTTVLKDFKYDYFSEEKTKFTSDNNIVIFQTYYNAICVNNLANNSYYKLVDETTKKDGFSSFAIVNNQLMLDVISITLTKIQLQLRNIGTGKLIDSIQISSNESVYQTKIITNQKYSPNFILLIELYNNTIESYISKIENNKIDRNYKIVYNLTINAEFIDKYIVTGQDSVLNFFDFTLKSVLKYEYGFQIPSFTFVVSKNILVVKSYLVSYTQYRIQNDVFNISNSIQNWHTNTFFIDYSGVYYQMLFPTSGFYYTCNTFQKQGQFVEVIDLKLKSVEVVPMQSLNRNTSGVYDTIYIKAGDWKEHGVAIIVDVSELKIKVFDDVKPYKEATSYKIGYYQELYEEVTDVKVKLASNKKHLIFMFHGNYYYQTFLQVRPLDQLSSPRYNGVYPIPEFQDVVPADISEDLHLTIAGSKGVSIIKL